MAADPEGIAAKYKDGSWDVIPSCCFVIFRCLISDCFHPDSQSVDQEFPSYVQVLFFRLL